MGPNLGMAKSSSLESLHNIVAHTIKRNPGVVKGDGVIGGRRAAVINHTLTRPVSTHSPVQSQYQYMCTERCFHSVSLSLTVPTFPADRRTRDNAVISFTKNPAKKAQKRSIFKKVFK